MKTKCIHIDFINTLTGYICNDCWEEFPWEEEKEFSWEQEKDLSFFDTTQSEVNQYRVMADWFIFQIIPHYAIPIVTEPIYILNENGTESLNEDLEINSKFIYWTEVWFLYDIITSEKSFSILNKILWEQKQKLYLKRKRN